VTVGTPHLTLSNLCRSDPIAVQSSTVTAESPLHLYLGRRDLIKTIEASVKCIKANAPSLDTTPAAKADTVHLLTQRAEFLVWLRAQEGDNVYISLHPVTEYVLADEAGTEVKEPPTPTEWQDPVED